MIDVKGYQDAISMLKMKMFAYRYGFPVTFAKFDSKINKSLKWIVLNQQDSNEKDKRNEERRNYMTKLLHKNYYLEK